MTPNQANTRAPSTDRMMKERGTDTKRFSRSNEACSLRCQSTSHYCRWAPKQRKEHAHTGLAYAVVYAVLKHLFGVREKGGCLLQAGKAGGRGYQALKGEIKNIQEAECRKPVSRRVTCCCASRSSRGRRGMAKGKRHKEGTRNEKS